MHSWIFLLTLITAVLSTYIPTNECLICLQSIATSQYTHFYDCEHVDIHAKCQRKWIRKQKGKATCPMCRAKRVSDLLPGFTTNTGSTCSNNSTLLAYSVNLGKWMISQNNAASLFHLFSVCEFKDEHHSLFFTREAMNGLWPLFERHLALVVRTRVLHFEDVSGAFAYALTNSKDRMMALMLDSTSTRTKVDYHINCIQNSQWQCSNAFIDYYLGLEGTLDVGQAFYEAFVSQMPLPSIKLFFSLEDSFLNKTNVCNTLDHVSRVKDWTRFDLIWAYVAEKKMCSSQLGFVLSRVFMWASMDRLETVMMHNDLGKEDLRYTLKSYMEIAKLNDTEVAAANIDYQDRFVLINAYWLGHFSG